MTKDYLCADEKADAKNCEEHSSDYQRKHRRFFTADGNYFYTACLTMLHQVLQNNFT